MINEERWINSIAKVNTRFREGMNQLDHNRWVNTIHKKNTYDSFNSFKKYSLMGILFVCGLLFVSVIKNETRNLQKEINNLQTAINVLKFDLDQAILDYEVITSPENISLLAKEYLSTDLVFYKRSQIKQLNGETKTFIKVNKIEKEKINKKKNKNLTTNIKSQVAKRIEKKKTEIRKLQQLYSNPKSVPGEIKTQVAKKIEEKKIELKNIYQSPKDIITLEKAGKWGVIQVVKAFLGMPIIPGK